MSVIFDSPRAGVFEVSGYRCDCGRAGKNMIPNNGVWIWVCGTNCCEKPHYVSVRVDTSTSGNRYEL